MWFLLSKTTLLVGVCGSCDQHGWADRQRDSEAESCWRMSAGFSVAPGAPVCDYRLLNVSRDEARRGGPDGGACYDDLRLFQETILCYARAAAHSGACLSAFDPQVHLHYFVRVVHFPASSEAVRRVVEKVVGVADTGMRPLCGSGEAHGHLCKK